MKYKEFLGAAKRHALCCHEIVNRYEELGKGHEKEKKALLNNAYYLSGYIIETPDFSAKNIYIFNYLIMKWL